MKRHLVTILAAWAIQLSWLRAEESEVCRASIRERIAEIMKSENQVRMKLYYLGKIVGQEDEDIMIARRAYYEKMRVGDCTALRKWQKTKEGDGIQLIHFFIRSCEGLVENKGTLSAEQSALLSEVDEFVTSIVKSYNENDSKESVYKNRAELYRMSFNERTTVLLRPSAE